jgi:hypothetical protein
MLEAGDDYLATLIDIFEQRTGEQRKAEAKAKARSRPRRKG